MILLKWANDGLFFSLFLFFANTNVTERAVDVSGIRTRIVGIEGKHADHLTTTTAHVKWCFIWQMQMLYTPKKMWSPVANLLNILHL